MKKITALFCAIAMVFAAIPHTMIAYAAGQPTLTVGSTSTYTNGEAVIEISITGNADVGLACFDGNLEYDKALSISKIERGTALPTLTFAEVRDLTANPVKLSFDGLDADYGVGTVLKITFRMPQEAGEYHVSMKDLEGNDQEMDQVSFNVVQGKITVLRDPSIKDEPTAEVPAGVTAVYGDTLGSITLTNPSGNTAGKWSWKASVSTKVGTAGTQTHTAVFTPNDTSKYMTVEKPVTITVKPKNLTVVGLTAKNRMYNGTTDIEIAGGQLSGVVAGDAVTAAMPTRGTVANGNIGNNKEVAFAAITLQGKDAANYTLIQPKLKVNITDKEKQNFKVRSNGTETKVYGSGKFTIGATGNVKGSTVTFTSSNPAVATVDNNGTVTIFKAGKTTITATASATATYAEATDSYVLTINKADVKVSARDQKIKVGDAIPDLSAPTLGTHYTVTGLVGNDKAGGTVVLKYQKDGVDVVPTSAAVNAYDIVISGATAPNSENYNGVILVNGKLNIVNKSSGGSGGGFGSGSNGGTGASTGETSTTTPTEPIVTTVETKDGNTAEITTEANGNKTIVVTTASGDKVAEVVIAAVPGEGKNFADVKPGDWYKSAVDKATAYGLFDGTGNGQFSPMASTTRSTIVTVLHNLSGKPTYGTNQHFYEDVTPGRWYENPITWAAKTGVASGVGNGKFEPNRAITREQLVTMLYNYAEIVGVDVKARASIGAFPDANRVDDYAKEAMQWAVAKGFISGRTYNGTNYLAPQGTATRAEAATVFAKFVEYLGK